MKERTLTQLLSEEKTVWLYIANKGTWSVFVNKATQEGFLWGDGRRLSKVKYDNIVALKKNMTMNYVGFIGHIWFKNQDDDTILKIDYAKYINGCEKYMYEF